MRLSVVPSYGQCYSYDTFTLAHFAFSVKYRHEFDKFKDLNQFSIAFCRHFLTDAV